MKKLVIILIMFFAGLTVHAQPFTNIQDGESGLAVRTNLNNVINYLNGLGLQLQFSSDKINWHYPFQTGDIYIRYSGNFGTAYSTPFYLWDGERLGTIATDELIVGTDTITSFGGGYVQLSDSVTKWVTATQLTNVINNIEVMQQVYRITLPSSTTIAGRISGAVEGADYPTGWVLEPGTSSVDLKVTHGLNKRVSQVTVFSVDGSAHRQLFGNAAYSGILTESANILRIESLATIQRQIVIYIVFV
jgi:hypothetical protein